MKLNKNQITMGALAIGAFVAYRAYNKFNGVIADAVTPAANFWVKLTTDAPVKTNSAYVFIKGRDIDQSGKLKSYFIETMTEANKDNGLIFNQLLDPYGRIKQKYAYLIDSDKPATLAELGS